MLKKEDPVYLPLTEQDRQKINRTPCRPILTKLLIVISSLAEVSFFCTSFIIQYAYGQSTGTLEFGSPTPGFQWGIRTVFFAMWFVGCYRVWCYYSAAWKLLNNPDTNMNTQNLVSCCGISFAILSFALEMTFLSLALASSAGLPGAPRLIIIAASQLLGIACCRLGIELARNNRSRCSLSGPLLLINVLYLVLLAAFLPTYGPIKGPCYNGLDYSSHKLTAQCKTGQDFITAPCWLANRTEPLKYSVDSILQHKPKTVSSTALFEVSSGSETKKLALVFSYLNKSWLPKVYSATVPQFSCAILEHDYCRSCSIEELSRLLVQVQVERNREVAEVKQEGTDNQCLLPQALEVKHNDDLSFRFCSSAEV